MEKIYCPICKSNDNSDLISVNNRLQEKDNVIYNIVKCICGLVYLVLLWLMGIDEEDKNFITGLGIIKKGFGKKK